MSAYLVTLVVVGSYLFAALLMLFLTGQLVRNDMDRAAAEREGVCRPRSRILEDLRPLQDAVVEFIAQTRHCAAFLRMLAQSKQPLTLSTLFERLQETDGGDRSDHSSREKEWAALFIMGAAGLVRFRGRGFVITDIGRNIEGRISGTSGANRNEKSTIIDVSDIAVGNHLTTASLRLHENTSISDVHRRIVSQALQTSRALPSVHQSRGLAPRNIVELRNSRRVKSLQNLSESKLIKEKTEPTHMKTRPIIMTAADHAELSFAIAAIDKLTERGRGEMKALQSELARANIVTPENLPSDVITMNSSAELLDLDTKERMEFTLVFPRDANLEEGRISILAPLGTAMLGYRVSDEFEWVVPYGLRRLRVTTVRFQPEAALAMAA